MLLVLLAILLNGCAVMMKQPEPPQVALADISLIHAGLFEQSFLVKLHLYNPNNYALPLDSFQIDLKLNNQPFLVGVSDTSVVLPRQGSAMVEMKTLSKLSGLLQQFQGVVSGDVRTVRYNLTGKVHLVRPLLWVPVREEGELDLSWLGRSGGR